MSVQQHHESKAEMGLDSQMPNHGFLTKLRDCLKPAPPVVLLSNRGTSTKTIEVEAYLSLTKKQAAAGKPIKLTLSASQCEKFNLPQLLNLQVPKNLEEGQRLKITDELWQHNNTSASKHPNQALILVIQLQEEPRSLWAQLFPRPTVIVEKIAVESTTQQQTISPSSHSTTTEAEQLTISLPLAILGGVHTFTTKTGHELEINIASGIANGEIMTVEDPNKTCFELKIHWELPQSEELSPNEKRLYEALMLLSLTKAGKKEHLKETLKQLKKQQTAEEA
jgi:hypothetical protein